jgi:hypothetical protein
VLEVHGFAAELTTAELQALLMPMPHSAELSIRWVDDTHALAVFASPAHARETFALRHKLPANVQLRTYGDWSAQARRKYDKSKFASASVSERPAARAPGGDRDWDRHRHRDGDGDGDGRERPVTTAAVASRLVGGALGIRVPRTAEQIAADKAKMDMERGMPTQLNSAVALHMICGIRAGQGVVLRSLVSYRAAAGAARGGRGVAAAGRGRVVRLTAPNPNHDCPHQPMASATATPHQSPSSHVHQ